MTKSEIETLWRATYPRVYAYIRRRVHTAGATCEVVEDLTSIVFLKAIEAIDSGKGPHTSVLAWLYRIARNLIIDHFRSQAQQQRRIFRHEQKSIDDYSGENRAGDYQDEFMDMPSPEPCPCQQAISTLGCEAIGRAMSLLTTRQAEIIALQAQGGYSAKELGLATGHSAEVAKQQLHRGRVRLRAMLETGGYAP